MSITCEEHSGLLTWEPRSALSSPATNRSGWFAFHSSSGGRAVDHQFDVLTRTFATCTSRRRALPLLAAMTVADSRPGRTSAAQEDASTCESELKDCAGACVDLQSDMNNCGACGEVCESGLVPVECRSGVCERANCPVGVEYCGAVDGCRDLSSDPGHCGACQKPCANGVCSGGVCSPGGGGCEEGQAECDGVCVDTCCNNSHCGKCGNSCPSGETCFEGICGCPSGLCCAEGEVNCNGTCVSTCCDNNNCGACGNVCKGGLTCFEGVCDCPSGKCPPVKLPNTGRGGTDMGTSRGAWVAAAMSGAAAVSALRWRSNAQSEPTLGSDDREASD